MTEVIISGALIPSSENTPIDLRSKIDTISNYEKIKKPYPGLRFRAEDSGKWYEVVSVKEVAEGFGKKKVIDQYKSVSEGSQESGKSFVTLLEGEYFSEIWLDGTQYPYAIYQLQGANASDATSDIVLNIIGTNVNDYGEILLIQKAYHKVLLGSDSQDTSIARKLIGEMDMSLNRDSVTLVKWSHTENGIYVEYEQILTNEVIPEVHKIQGFTYTFADAHMCQLRWYSPTTHNETIAADSYEIRYSKNPYTEEEAKSKWVGLGIVNNTLIPKQPGEIENLNVFGLQANTTYYFYIRARKQYMGVMNTSEISTLKSGDSIVGVSTTSDLTNSVEDSSIQRIPLYKSSIFTKEWSAEQVNTINNVKVDGRETLISNSEQAILDADSSSDGAYPELSSTSFEYGLSFNENDKSYTPYYITVDLFQKYALTRLYMCTNFDSSRFPDGGYSIYVKENLDSDWEEYQDYLITTGTSRDQIWNLIDLTKLKGSYRFVRIGFDRFIYSYGSARVHQLLSCDSNTVTDISRNEGMYPNGFEDNLKCYMDNGYGSNPYMTTIYGLILYGKRVSDEIPVGIMPARRRLFEIPVLGEVHNIHLYGYERARLATLCGGGNNRLYFALSNFSIYQNPDVDWNGMLTDGGNQKKSNTLNFSTRELLFSEEPEVRKQELAKLVWNLHTNTWIRDQGRITGLRDGSNATRFITYADHFKYNFSKYGSLPYIAPTVAPVELCAAHGTSYKYRIGGNIQSDQYWGYAAVSNQLGIPYNSVAWRGWKSSQDLFENPVYYALRAKFNYCLLAKFGFTEHTSQEELQNIFLLDTITGTESGIQWKQDTSTGLKLLSGIEYRNEPESDSSGDVTRGKATILATIDSALSDGNQGATRDSEYSLHARFGGYPYLGAKNADPECKTYGSGRANTSAPELFDYYMHWLKLRSQLEIDNSKAKQIGLCPLDFFCTHTYSTTRGQQGGGKYTSKTMGISFSATKMAKTNENFWELPEIRDRYLPKMQICNNEWGWGEAGSTDSNSVVKYALMSLPSTTYMDDALTKIPPVYRSDLKGYFIIQGICEFLEAGYTNLCYYQLRNESDYFNPADGALFEMFHWDDVADDQKITYVNNNGYVNKSGTAGSGFATTALFGGDLKEGYYPITRAAWIQTSFYNALKDYTFMGMKKYSIEQDADSKVKIAVFKKEENGKTYGAYVVWYNNYETYMDGDYQSLIDKNGGRKHVEIALPLKESADGNPQYSAKKFKYYIPAIPNPNAIPYDTKAKIGVNGMVTGHWEATNEYDQADTTIKNPANRKYRFVDSSTTGTESLVCKNHYRSALPTTRRERWNPTTEIWENWNLFWGAGDENSEAYAQKGVTIADDDPRWFYKTYTCRCDGEEIRERFLLPTTSENPYFPLVGPVNHDQSFNAQQYTTNANGDTSTDAQMYLRQYEAICDYMEFTEEGKKGCGLHPENWVDITATQGDEYTSIEGSKLITDATQKPHIYIFEGVPEITFQGQCTNLSAIRRNSSTIELFWNNSDPRESAYDIYISSSGTATVDQMEFLKRVTIDGSNLENKATITGLTSSTAYTLGVIPVYAAGTKFQQTGKISDLIITSTPSNIAAPVLSSPLQTVSSVKLSWTSEGQSALDNDFVCYEIYRSSMQDASDRTLIATVRDLSLKTYTDSGLFPSRSYYYTVRLRLKDQYGEYYSNESNRIEPVTKTKETSDTYAISGSLSGEGDIITLNTDIELSSLSTSSSPFTVTQGGVEKTVTSVVIDAGKSTVFIHVTDMSDYLSGEVIRVSYSGTTVKTQYGNNLIPFEGMVIANKYGKSFDMQFAVNLRTSNVTTLNETGDSGVTSWHAPNLQYWNTAITGRTLAGLIDYTDKNNPVESPYMLSFVSGGITIGNDTYNSEWLSVTDEEGGCTDIKVYYDKPYGNYELGISASDPVLPSHIKDRFNVASDPASKVFDFATYSMIRAGYSVFSGNGKVAILQLSGLNNKSTYKLNLLISNQKDSKPNLDVTFTNGSDKTLIKGFNPNAKKGSSYGGFVTAELKPLNNNLYIILSPNDSSLTTASTYNYFAQALIIEEIKEDTSTDPSQEVELREVGVEEFVANYNEQYSE